MIYTSQADLGGQEGQGPVRPELEGEIFHAPWEPRVLALSLAMGATDLWNLDMSRAARETLADYRSLSYYQIWLAALEILLLRSGAVDAEELRSGRSSGPVTRPAPQVLKADRVAAALAKGTPTARAPIGPARFSIGQPVRTLDEAPRHHTRLPAYVRGKRGVVDRVHGVHVFADTHAQGLGEQPQWLYTVTFDEAELWGATRPRQGVIVSVDAWESYLRPVLA